MSYDDAPKHVRLAVEFIRKSENMDSSAEVTLQACLLLIQDTFHKLPKDERAMWCYKINASLAPISSNRNVKQISI